MTKDECQKQLDKDAIFKANDVRIERVDVPEWGGHVYVKTMSGTERDRMELFMEGKTEAERFQHMRAAMAVFSVCDAEGVLLFSPDDIPALGEKNSRALDRVFTKASDLSRIGAAQVGELEKN